MYSVIIPCYKSSHTIREVVELTAAKLEELGRTPFEFVLVDDCSPDECGEICEEYKERDVRIKVFHTESARSEVLFHVRWPSLRAAALEPEKPNLTGSDQRRQNVTVTEKQKHNVAERSCRTLFNNCNVFFLFCNPLFIFIFLRYEIKKWQAIDFLLPLRNFSEKLLTTFRTFLS